MTRDRVLEFATRSRGSNDPLEDLDSVFDVVEGRFVRISGGG